MKRRRVAVITGASSGIGRALAERAVRAGWDVLAVGRRTQRLDELSQRVSDASGNVVTLTVDVRNAGASARIVGQALEHFGRLDVLVNNAGGVAVGPIAQQSDAALREQMETHVIVPLALTREALAALRETKGQVFYVGSGVARIPVGTLGAYPPAKAAVRNMARIVRNELRGAGIAVTYVDPGAVATEFMTRAGFAGPPPHVAASPQAVARKIFAAFDTRQPVVNAVPWQTAFVALGEAFPGLTDYVLRRAPQIVGGKVLSPGEGSPASHATAPVEPPLDQSVPSIESVSPHAPSAFQAALEPQRNRMRKLNLSEPFVRGLLMPGAQLELGDVALRWAGMPNKNERGLTGEVLEALAVAGFLERLEPERYRVLRGADAC